MLSSREPFNPAWAIRALVSYDRWLWQRVSAASDCERMAMTLSGYNVGLGWEYNGTGGLHHRGADTRWTVRTCLATVECGRNAASWREGQPPYPRSTSCRTSFTDISWEAAVVWHLVKKLLRGAAFCWPFLSMPFWSTCMPWDAEVVMTLQA